MNSFGYGGTNAHCILDDAYHYLKSRGLRGAHNSVTSSTPTTNSHSSSASDLSISDNDAWHKVSKAAHVNGNEIAFPKSDTWSSSKSTPKLLFWTSHEQTGSERTSEAFLDYLRGRRRLEDNEDSITLDRLAYTLSEGRSRLPWKTFVVVSDVDELCNTLEKSPPKPLRSSQVPVLGFVFTGQGAQWFAMGRELIQYSVFRESLEAAETYLKLEGCKWALLGKSSFDFERIVLISSVLII